MRRAAAISCLALALALAALSPASAPAAGSKASAWPGFVPQLQLRTASGYHISVSEHFGAVTLTVARWTHKRGAAQTTYVARGTTTGGRLQASFGRFGRLSMRFRPSAARARLAPHGHCHGPGTLLVRHGVFAGTLRFRGEGGYVSVRAHRAKGRMARLARRCFHHLGSHHRESLIRVPQGDGSGSEVTYLAAQWKGPTASRTFVALRLKKKVAFIAMTSADAGKVSLFHTALRIARPGAFSLDDALARVRVTPGAPFKGAGTYSAAPDGTKTWDGPLAVNFPGTPRFALTGPPLEATVGTLPAIFALFLLKSARVGDGLALAATEQPSLLTSLGS